MFFKLALLIVLTPMQAVLAKLPIKAGRISGTGRFWQFRLSIFISESISKSFDYAMHGLAVPAWRIEA